MLNEKQVKQPNSGSSRLIEEIFPIKKVSDESAKEKSIRHGHISTLHIWWARRPLASSRATAYAALIPNPQNKIQEEIQRKEEFIIQLCKWENTLNRSIIDRARKDIQDANNGVPPKVLDPFAGGGSIPLETLRLGCETYSNEYNPVAILLQKCVLEYPQKYLGNSVREKGHYESSMPLLNEDEKVPLLEDVRKWASWILGEAREEIEIFYPKDSDGSIPVGYIWSRTIQCQNPSCNTEIPLIRQYWIANKNERKVSLHPIISHNGIEFEIVGTGNKDMPKGFDPKRGTVSKGIVTCPKCSSVADNKVVARMFTEGKSGQRMIAVIVQTEGKVGKKYRVAENRDFKPFEEAKTYLEKKRTYLTNEWGIDPVPDEPLPPIGTLGFRVQRYGMNNWGEVFNPRQQLSLITFVDKSRKAHERMIREGYDAEYAKVVLSYISIIINRLADKNSLLVKCDVTREKIQNVFSRAALGMVWDYAELNPFTYVGWCHMQIWVELVLRHCIQTCMKTQVYSSTPIVTQSSATSLPYPDNFFDAIFTDPPYYDNIPYSYLSDFFYVWLKRSVGNLYPDMFATPLTPKSMEIVAYSNIPGGWEAGKKFFEDMLKKSFIEINRVLKPNGVAIIVYAHKSTAGWETMLNSLLDSGLVVTAAWPINTEMGTRLRAKESAALASSIYLVTRKLKREKTGFYREIKDELRKHLSIKLDKLWSTGIAGADLFIAAIGSSIEVYGKYEKVLDDEGNIVRADRFLEIVQAIVTDYAINKILHNGFAAQISRRTRLYLLWRWAYGEARVPFDDALKLSRSIGIDLSNEWANRGSFIQKDKEFIRVLGPEERQIKELEESSVVNQKEMIDVLHSVLLLWKKGKKDELMKILKETGFGNNDIFYRVAQAISETLSNTNKEKKLLEGFLSGKRRVSEESRKDSGQTRLFEEE